MPRRHVLHELPPAPPPPAATKQAWNLRGLLIPAFMSVLLVTTLYQYLSLQSSYQDLSTRYAALSSRYDYLQSSYNSLNSQHIQLQDNYSNLVRSYSDLQSNYQSLRTSYASLEQQHQSLQTTYSILQSRYSSLSAEKTDTGNWYASIRDQINLRLGFAENRKSFVTPDDTKVGDLVNQVTGGWSNTSDWNEYWSDLRKMYDWVINNIAYSYDSPLPEIPEMGGLLQWRTEFWRFPNETIADRHGDCEDQALLLISMIGNYNKKEYTIWVVEFQSESSGHLAVAFPVVGGKLTILDPAGRFFTRDTLGNLASKDVGTAVGDWIQYWNNQGQKNVRITLVFSQTQYKKFSSTDEFIQWASQQ